MCSLMSGFVIDMLGLVPVFCLNWSTMASLTLYVTKRELRNSSEYTTESTENVFPSGIYSAQSMVCTSLYTSSAELALKWRIGFSMRIAVCNWKLARYIISLSPENETILLPICTLFAPSWVSSCAKTDSKPMNVLAMSSNSILLYMF